MYLDRQKARRERQEDRLDAIRTALVSSRQLDLKAAWPEFFGPAIPDTADEDEDETGVAPETAETAFPATDADMSEFQWERPTPESYQNDMDALMTLNQHISVPEETHISAPVKVSTDLEWT